MKATTRRWLARASFALMLAAVVLVLAVAGWRSLALAGLAVIGVCAVLAGGYWFLANRGVLRWLALVLVIAAPVLIVVVFALHHLVWVAVVAVALMVAAAATARAALSTGGQDAAMAAVPAARPRRPFVIMNPRSGGGKVTKFGLQEKAEALGAEVALLQGPGPRSLPSRSPWTPTRPRSRSASTARPSCCPPRSTAPSSPGRSGWSCRENAPASPPPSRPWNGRGCGNSLPSAPTPTASPSPPSQTGNQARMHNRRPAGSAFGLDN